MTTLHHRLVIEGRPSCVARLWRRRLVARALGVAAGILLGAAVVPAAAQRVSFERSYDAGANVVLDVTTVRGKIEVVTGDAGRAVVAGTVSVRPGWNILADGMEVARRVAKDPPVQQDGTTLRLRPPASEDDRRAVTVAYRVVVPPHATVTAVSDSGAVTVSGVAGHVAIRTQSAAITVRDLQGSAAVDSGSGAIVASGVAGDLRVSTQSSAITLRKLGAGLRARTQSGAVRAWLIGRGDVEVETGSSAIDLEGVAGGLIASSNSGHMRISGTPLAPWRIVKHSGGVDLLFERDSKMTLDVSSGSGKISVDGLVIDGSSGERQIAGTVSGGGAPVQVRSRSGSVNISGS